MPSDEERAHSRDYDYKARLRATRSALIDLAEDESTSKALAEVLIGLAERLKREEGYIVARWN